MIEGVIIEKLHIIPGELGDIFPVLKNSDTAYQEFGEAYFSSIQKGVVKGWKRHREMTLNIVVPVGAIRFALVDRRTGSASKNSVLNLVLSPENYCRLTVPPGIWMAFQGIGEDTNLLLNLASIPHDPTESENAFLSDARFSEIDWSS